MSFLPSSGSFPAKDAKTATNYAGGEYSTNLKFLPNPGQWPVTAKDTLDSTAVSTSTQQLSVAAENSVLRIIYGQVLIGPLIANVLTLNGSLVILAVWGHGEIDSIVSYYIDDKVPVAGVTATHYLGTAGQGIDDTLVDAIDAAIPGTVFTDTMAGIAYSVIKVPVGASEGFPRITALIKGRKVFNGTTTEWSDNPAYCIADFITNTEYGMSRTVNWASVTDVANDCDYLVSGTDKLRTINLCIDSPQPSATWLDTLRTYAGCWVVQDTSGDLKLVSDKASTTVAATFSSDLAQISSISNIVKRGVQTTPTVMLLTYTSIDTNTSDVSAAPIYKEATVTVVINGGIPRRESAISLPGITRYSQAYREAVERLKKLYMNDLSFTLGVFDIGIGLDIGDIIEVTHPVGISTPTGGKKMRVMSISGEYGRYSLGLNEYDEAVYNTELQSGPTYLDTGLPNYTIPPNITGLNMSEELFEVSKGITGSRWRATWDKPDHGRLKNYRVILEIPGSTIADTTTTTNSWVSPAIQAIKDASGLDYTLRVSAVTQANSVGTASTVTKPALGKFIKPGDVNINTLQCFEAGGRVYIAWGPVADVDIWRYEVRWGTTASTWETAAVLDIVDALTTTSDQIPVGTWKIYVKAIDSVLQSSTNAVSKTITVTTDASAFLVDVQAQVLPTTNMQVFSKSRTDTNTYYITEDNVMFGTKFSANMSTYTNPLATYHNSMTSTWEGKGSDFGNLLGGQWTGTSLVNDLSGIHTSYMGFSAQDSGYVYYTGLSQKLNARWARIKHEALGTSTMLVTSPVQEIRIDAIPRQEVGTGISSTSAAVQVVLENKYVATKKLSVTAIGATARNAVVDNIQTGDIDNGTFEANVLGWVDWTTPSTITRSTAQFHSGVASLSLYSAAESAISGRARAVNPGDIVTVSVWIKSSVSVAGGIHIRASGSPAYPTNGYVIATTPGLVYGYGDKESVTANTSWQQFVSTITVPAGIFWMSPTIYKWTPLNGATLYIDDVTITNFKTSFDVYVFDTAGNKISPASAFQFEYQGV